jgi:signal transduction histidine kinase
MRLLEPLRKSDTYRALLFYVVDFLLGLVGFVLILAAWPVTLVFAITPLVVPLLIAFRATVGALAQAEGAAARSLLGSDTRPSAASRGRGFWDRGFAVLRDRAFWKQQVHLLIAWPMALVPLALLGWAGQLLSLPVWYRWADSSDVLGLFEVDSFGEALPFAGLGLVLIIATAHLLGLWARLSRRLASALLSGNGGRIRTAEEMRVLRTRALTITSLAATTVALALLMIWELTSGSEGYFWPAWPLLALSLVVGIFGSVVLVFERPEPARYALGSRALAIQIGGSVVLVAFLVGVWVVAGGGYFWPIWPALGLAILAAAHAAVVYGRREHRIRQLEQTRAGAVDVQETELRRIERDLHDGAQARLVALGMSLGRAEQALDTDPDAVRRLLAEAREGAGEALEELRDLARGIRPPILTDRGLKPAVEALVARTPMPVTLSVEMRDRYPSAIETAAYFTVAEALANAIKHADAQRINIRLAELDSVCIAEVTDDGVGGADAAGPGLVGLRQRAEALDGTLRVDSPVGGPTTVRVELPCGS